MRKIDLVRASFFAAGLFIGFLLTSCSSRPQDLELERKTPSPCIAGKVESSPGIFTTHVWIRWAGVEVHDWDQDTLDRLDYPACT